nr:MAG: hypothetical protein [Picornavirales sp.]
MNQTHFNSFASTSANSFQGNSNLIGTNPLSEKDQLEFLSSSNNNLTPFGQNPEDPVEPAEEASDALVEHEAEAEGGMESSMAGPIAIGALAINNAVTSQQVSSDIQKDQSGQGLAGSSFATNFQQRVDVEHDQTVGLENTALIAGGSLFGPEGTAAGLLAAGANSALNQAPEATVTSNLGTQVPVSSL